jgi:hypothetical protein
MLIAMVNKIGKYYKIMLIRWLFDARQEIAKKYLRKYAENEENFLNIAND